MQQKIEELEKRIKQMEETIIELSKLTNIAVEYLKEHINNYNENMNEIQKSLNGKSGSVKTKPLKGSSIKQMLFNAGIGKSKK